MLSPVLALLVGGSPTAPEVRVDGLRVPPSQVRVVAGRTLVACGWLEQVSAAFRCVDSRSRHGSGAVVQAVTPPDDGLRNIVFTPTSTTVQTYRAFNFRDPQPLPERATFGKDLFIPLRSLAAAFQAPLTVQSRQVALGRPVAFAKLSATIEQGSLFEARTATNWLKVRNEIVIPQPSGKASEVNDNLRLWPQGEVLRQFNWWDDVVTYSEVRDGWLVTRWAGKLADNWTHEQRNAQPSLSGKGIDTLSRYLGNPFAQQRGQRPLVQPPLSFEAGHMFGISNSSAWGQITPTGREIVQFEAYYQYGDRLVRGKDGVMTKAIDPLPDPYAAEIRIDRRP